MKFKDIAFIIIAASLYLAIQSNVLSKEKFEFIKDASIFAGKKAGGLLYKKTTSAAKRFGGYVQDKGQRFTSWTKDSFSLRKKREEKKKKDAETRKLLDVVEHNKLTPEEKNFLSAAEAIGGKPLNNFQKAKLLKKYHEQ